MFFGLGGVGSSREKIFISYSRPDNDLENSLENSLKNSLADVMNSFRETETSFADKIITVAELLISSSCVWSIDTRAADLDINSYSLRTTTKYLMNYCEAKLKSAINRFEADFRRFARSFVSAQLSAANNWKNSSEKSILSDLTSNYIGVINSSCANKILSRSCRCIEKVKLKFVRLFSASEVPGYALKVPSEINILQICEVILRQLSMRQFSLKSFLSGVYRRRSVVGLMIYYTSKKKNFKGRETIPMCLFPMRLSPMRLVPCV